MAIKCTVETQLSKREGEEYEFLNKKNRLPSIKKYEDIILQSTTTTDAQRVVNEWIAEVEPIGKEILKTKDVNVKRELVEMVHNSLIQKIIGLGLEKNPFLKAYAMGIRRELNKKVNDLNQKDTKYFTSTTANNIASQLEMGDRNLFRLLQKLNFLKYRDLKHNIEGAHDEFFGDHPFYAGNRESAERMMKFMTGDHPLWKKGIHLMLAKYPAFLKVAAYAGLRSLAGSASGFALVTISALGIYNNIKYINNRTANIMPNMNAKQRKAFYTALGLKEGSLGSFDFIGNIFDKLNVVTFFTQLMSGASGPDIMMRGKFAKFGYDMAAMKYRDNSLSVDENISIIKILMQDAEVRNDIINTAQTVARQEAGMANFRGGEITNLGTLGLVSNILGAWSLNKSFYYMRGLARGDIQRRRSRELEIGIPHANENFNQRFMGNADMGIMIGMLGHGLMTAYRIAAAMEADDGDDEDELFMNMLEIYMNSAQGLAALFSNPILRTPADMVSAIWRSAGYGDEQDLLDAIEKYDPNVRYNYGTILFLVDQLNKILTGAKTYLGIITNIQREVRNPDNTTTEGIMLGLLRYQDRLDAYMNDELYLSDNDPEFRSMGTNAIMNFLTGIQTNPYKKYGNANKPLEKWLISGAGEGLGGSLIGMLYAMGPESIIGQLQGLAKRDSKGADLYKIGSAISADEGLYNFVYNSDATGLTNKEAAYGYYKAVDPRATYNIELNPETGVRKDKYNERELEAVEGTLQEFLGEEKMEQIKRSINNISSGNKYEKKAQEYLIETAAFLDVLAESYRGNGEKHDQRVNILGQQFLAYAMGKTYESKYKEMGFKSHGAVPTDVSEILQAETYKQYAPIHRLTDKSAFETIANFAIYKRNEDLRPYFNDPYTSDGAAIKDVTISGSMNEKNNRSGVLLGMEKIAKGEDLAQIGTDVQKIYSSALNKISMTDEHSQKDIEILQKGLVAQHLALTEMARRSGIYSEEDIGYFVANSYMNNKKAYNLFQNSEDIPLEERERVAAILYDAHVINNLFDLDGLADPSDKLKEYYNNIQDDLQPKYRRGSGGGKRHNNNYYKPLYSQYRKAYNNPLSSIANNYGKKLFSKGGVRYNDSEWSYLKHRSRLNRIDTVYPVFDLSGLGASTGFSKATPVSTKKYPAGQFKFENKRGGRLIRKGKNKPLKVKRGRISFE